MKKNKDIIIYIGAILLSLVFIFLGNKYVLKDYQEFMPRDDSSMKAKVVEILEITNEKELEISDEEDNIIIFFTAKILNGDRKGEELIAKQFIYTTDIVPLEEISEGDKVLLIENAYYESEDDWLVADYIRSDGIIKLFILFSLCLIIVCGVKGLNTLLSLIMTVLSIFLVFVPAILSGKNIYLWTIIICLYIVIVNLVLINGINQKSISSFIGCAGGGIFAGIFTLFINNIMKITGFISDESMFLLMLKEDISIDLRGIIFSTIIIGCIGALLDVAVDISSALTEVDEKMKHRNFKSLFNSGMNIGKDSIATMASTLVLAYVGSSLATVLLIFAYNNSLFYTMNMEMIVVEILQSIIGSLGMLVTIPLTSLASAYLYTSDLRKDKGIIGLKEEVEETKEEKEVEDFFDIERRTDLRD